MGIFSYIARKNVSVQCRKGLKWQYHEARGEIGQEAARLCLLSPNVCGYVFGYITSMIGMQRISSKNADKALRSALGEVFEDDCKQIYEHIDRYGHGKRKSIFNREANRGEVDAEKFVLKNSDYPGLKVCILEYYRRQIEK